MLLVFFFTRHRHLMLSHPDLKQRQGFGSYPQPSNAHCPVPTNRWDAFYTVQGVIVDILGAGSLTVTRNESFELLGCHWFDGVHCTPAKTYVYLYPTAN